MELETRHLKLVLRLDLFLKASRLLSRRSVAQQFCEARRLSVNDQIAKSSHAVKVGDEIMIRRTNRVTTVRVVAVPDSRQTAKKDAASLYELVSEETFAEDPLG
ncbi:MAG TPA: S4 domain-containing protein [Pyrinomonadaceae bacterium]|nr:S4 domain-containing protein [Pyrinomonadaceae bacterium]